MNRNNKSFHFVYITEDLITHKKYVGQHSTNNIYDKYIGSGTLLLNRIKKYGKKNFKTTILEYGQNSDQLDILERKYIKEYNTFYPNGYNLTTGGESKKIYSLESRIKISKANKGRKLTKEQILKIIKKQTGSKRSEETKQKMSIAGKKRIFSEETRQKMSNSAKGKILSEETKQKISNANKGKLLGDLNPMKKGHTEETKKKISEKLKGKFKGRKMSQEQKNKISLVKKGIPSKVKGIKRKQHFINVYGEERGLQAYIQCVEKIRKANLGKKLNKPSKLLGRHLPQNHKDNIKKSLTGLKHNLKLVKCPYCGKEGKGGNMTRYHFNKCKLNIN